MNKSFVDTVRLLLDVAPDVFQARVFAMTGGTALNLFVQDMPRLSVDIDVVYVAHATERSAALTEIGAELNLLTRRLTARNIEAEIAATKTGDETKVLVRRGRQQVKIEVNHVFRGTILPIEQRALSKTASDLFTTSLTAPTLAVPELYGSKLVAAMDRQHPRDLFDVHGMFRHLGLQRDVVESFVCYLAGHNRPVHEVLFSRDLDLSTAYQNEFDGMARESVLLADLETARKRLRHELLVALTDSHKRFLLGLVNGSPEWDLMRCPHLSELPAIQWKQRNLAQLKRSNPVKFRKQASELEARLNTL